MAALLFLWIALLTQASDRAVLAEVRVEGPLFGAELVLPDGSRTVLEGQLRGGESRSLRIPLGLPSALRTGSHEAWPAPRVELDGKGSLTFEGWIERPDFVADLAPTLRFRGPPPAGARRARLPVGTLAALPAIAWVVWFARRRVWAVAASALGIAALLSVAPVAAPPAVSVLELDRASPTGVRVRSGARRVEVDAVREAGELRVSVEPEEEPVVWTVPLDGEGGWTASAVRGALVVREKVRGFAVPDPESNDTGIDFERSFRRRPDGVWESGGFWGMGEPFEMAESGIGPPGWLAAGLPQGVAIFVGLDGRRGEWVRATGF